MRTRVIGIGAAGNKAAMTVFNDGTELAENILLINSTAKDIPKDYEGKFYLFNGGRQGAGKEREIAKQLTLEALQSGDLSIGDFLKAGTENEAELVVLVSSTEGGTGSGSVPILAKYIQEVLGIQAHCFAFTGFEEDGRGLKNTVEYFKDLSEDFTIECIQNSKYLTEENTNRIKAELQANKDFSRKVAVLFGNMLRDSDHNIDPTDLYKISTEPGYMNIEYQSFSKIKNSAQFRSIIRNMIDDSKTLDLNTPSQKKLAVMINVREDNTDIIDYQDILEEYYGVAYEKFEHIQYEEDMDEFVAYISAGSKVPVEEIESIYDRYKERTSKVDKKKDDFFTKSFEFNQEDSMFDLHKKKKKTISSDNFFKNIDTDSEDDKHTIRPEDAY